MQIFYSLIARLILFVIQKLSFGDKLSEKLIDTIALTNYQVYTETGWENVSAIHLTKPFKIYEAIFKNEHGDRKYIKAADHHLLFYSPTAYKRLENFNQGDKVYTKDGYFELEQMNVIESYVNMFDLTVDSENHSYYTNDILSHNTISAAIFIAHFVTFNFDKNVLIVANKGKTVKEIITKTKDILKELPFFLQPGILINNQSAMAFDNGCRIIGETASKNPAIGLTIHCLYADEFAHINPNIVDSYYRSIRPTISSIKDGKFIITSTPNGHNKFFEIWTDAINGKNTFHPIRVDWWQVPGRDEQWALNEIANSSEADFNQEYGIQFLGTGAMLLDSIEFMRMSKMCRPYTETYLEELDDWGLKYKSSLFFDKKFDIEKLYNKEAYFVLGVDGGEGGGGDANDTVIIISQIIPMLSKDIKKLIKPSSISELFALKQVGYFKNNTYLPEDTAKFLYILTHEIISPDNVKIVIEANNVGQLIIEKLHTVFPQINEFGDEMLFKFKHTNDAQFKKMGFKMKNDNKAFLCNLHKQHINSGRIFITSHAFLEQYEHFGKDGNSYKATIGKDDAVMAAVLTSSVFGTEEWVEMCEEYFDYLPISKQNEIEDAVYNQSPEKDDEYEELYSAIVSLNHKINQKYL